MRQMFGRVANLLILISTPTTMTLMSQFALAQASPFLTGANALQTNILAWLTPLAIILIMVLGGMAMANRVVDGEPKVTSASNCVRTQACPEPLEVARRLRDFLRESVLLCCASSRAQEVDLQRTYRERS